MTEKPFQQVLNDRHRNDRRNYARRLLLHYFDLSFNRGFGQFSFECQEEVKAVIDSIFDEMDDLSARLDALEAKAND
jgi:hypothetical protein